MTGTATKLPHIVSVFNECQETSLSHDRLLSSLMDLYTRASCFTLDFCTMPFSHFAEDFFELCRYSLVSAERTVFRERTIDFIVRAVVHISANAAEREDGNPRNLLLVKMFLFCAKYHECVKHAPRFRCTQFIHKLLEAMGSEACLPVELFDIIQRVLLRRSTDVKPMIRVQAALGLARLQNPTDRKCPVIEQLLWLSRHDTSPDVRRAALAAIVLTTFTLPVVVERCRDVSDTVRKTAYSILAQRSVVRPLSIAKRIAILQDGLTDTSPDVRKAAEAVVIAWFNFLDQDPILLLRRLDTEGVPKTSKLCLDHLLPNLEEDTLVTVITKWAADYLDERHIPKPDRCSVECVFFWRVIIEYLLKRQNADDTSEVNNQGEEGGQISHAATTSSSPGQIAALLERITPSVSDYVNFIIHRVDSLLVLLRADVDYNENVMEAESVLEHVLLLCESLDLSDEFGRRRLFDVVRGWLVCPQVPASLTKFLLQIYFNLESNVQNRVLKVAEMTSELLESAEEAAKQQNLSVQTTVLTAVGTSGNHGDVSSRALSDGRSPAEPSHQPQAKPLNKARETYLRIKVAELKVKLNELNESLSECIRVKDFERATSLRDECARLEGERSALLHELTGINLPICTPDTNSRPALSASSVHVSGTMKAEMVTEEVVEIIDSEEEEEENDESDPKVILVRRQIKYLSRLSADVVLKANKMVVVTIQKSPSLWSLPPSLRSLLYNLILPSVQHTDLAIRNQAILALGLCCTLDLALTKSYLSLFYEAVKLDHATVRVTAINCIIDVFVIFGLHPFLEVAEKFDEVDLDIGDLVLLKSGRFGSGAINTTASETISLALRLLAPMVELIDSDDADLRTAAGVGVAKLFIFGRLLSGRLISRLLLLWFNPQTAELPTLSQSLGVFFTDFACSSPERQACVADAVLPTLTILVAAPATSALSEIDPGLVVDLLARLTDASCLFPKVQSRVAADGGEDYKSTDNPCHDDLAMRLSNRVLNAPQSAEARLYIRVLSQLRLSLYKAQLYKDLLRMTDLMFKKVERSAFLSLHRFRKNIQASISASGLTMDDFLLEGSDVVVQQSGPSLSPHAEDRPTLLESPGPSKLNLEEEEGLSQRTLIAQNEELRSTVAGLSFRGPSLASKLLVFSDDENNDKKEGEGEGIVISEKEGEEDGEASMIQTRQTSSKPLTRSRIRVCKTPTTTTATRNIRTASKARVASVVDRESMPPPSSSIAKSNVRKKSEALRSNVRRSSACSSTRKKMRNDRL
ncbi:Condensin complex subunit 3 [Echinococcus granulosus]|uniref:Condensin complex subunit 3 n=1 Tax=Echinococcus granulosus TaxID=6210 RepID=A0A068WNF3_ECHGR|nr:Condensin complex subunit 3 [Echinococcus granulosus]CDS19205.1 condensin complex subunit 3 [Echinococcus granulosus]